jgi:hypothetical protein
MFGYIFVHLWISIIINPPNIQQSPGEGMPLLQFSKEPQCHGTIARTAFHWLRLCF